MGNNTNVNRKVTVEFKNVDKSFNIYKNNTNSIKETFINSVLRRDKKEVIQNKVLSNASFKIYEGDSIGIIGENGTGKSTTLKLVSKILNPDSGEIIVNGKIASLLEVGIGFQQDLTGRENVYLYGSILGLKKKEIDEKYNEIVNFAEIPDFMDTPVKNYSSGMYMRLAFSVAVSIDPEILLVDEVLAVGDSAFQKKCLDKIIEFKNSGKTIIFVSHDMGAIKKISDRVLFIKRGGELIEGSSKQMIGLYLKLVHGKEADEEASKNITKENINEVLANFDYLEHMAVEYLNIENKGNLDAEITNVYFSNAKGILTNIFSAEDDIKINMQFNVKKEIESAIIKFQIYTKEGVLISEKSSQDDGIILTDIANNNFISINIKNFKLLPRHYYVSLILTSDDENIVYDSKEKRYVFVVDDELFNNRGIIGVECEWEL